MIELGTYIENLSSGELCILIIGHPLSSSSIYSDQCSFYVLDSPLVQPLSRSSLVFLLVLDPQLHTP